MHAIVSKIKKIFVVIFLFLPHLGLAEQAAEENTAQEEVSDLEESHEEAKADKKKPDQKKSNFTVSGNLQFNSYFANHSNRNSNKFSSGPALTRKPNQVPTQMFSLEKSFLLFNIEDDMDFAGFNKWLAAVMLSADRAGNTLGQFVVPQVYARFLSDYATLYLGDYLGAADQMAFTGNSVLGGAGGFNSKYTKIGFLTSGVYSSVDMLGSSEMATKITLLSPSWNNVKFGVSFTPNSTKLGSAAVSTPPSITPPGPPFYNKNVVEVGINYVQFITDDLQLSLSLTGLTGASYPLYEQGSSAPQKLEFNRTQTFAIGGILEWNDLSFGLSYHNCLKTGQLKHDQTVTPPTVSGESFSALDYKASNAEGPRYVIAGASYIMGDTKLAVGYYHSQRRTGFSGKSAIGNIYNASITYQIQPGLATYVAGNYAITKNPASFYEGTLLATRLSDATKASAVIDNKNAKVLIVGLKLNF